jgi:hypothetical protein
MPTYVNILRIPHMICVCVWTAKVQLYIDRGKPKNSEKTCTSAILSARNPTWIDPEANPDLCGEKPETNDLSNGKALYFMLLSQSKLPYSI